MIIDTKGKLAADVMEDRVGKGFPSDLLRRARTLFRSLDEALDINDLRFPPGNNLQKLGGGRNGQYSIRINRQWRICFVWTDQGPDDVEIVDYH